jgi:transposase
VAAVARATGMAISTVRKGRDEARAGARPADVVRVRRSAGKRPHEVAHPEVWPALEKLVDPITRGDPESPLRWTCKSTHALSAELFAQHGVQISYKTVAKLLRDHGYSLQAPNKSVEGAQHSEVERLYPVCADCGRRGCRSFVGSRVPASSVLPQVRLTSTEQVALALELLGSVVRSRATARSMTRTARGCGSCSRREPSRTCDG